jgi:hypothetical protein
LVGVVAAPLLAHVAQRVLGAALLELVEHDHVGEIEHVDLLELARRAVFGRHHVQGQVRDIDDLGVALPDARRLDEHEIEARGPVERDHVRQHRAGGEMLAARRERAHENLRGRERVHADAVSQQRAAGTSSRRIDGDHGDLPVGKRTRETQQQLVGERALARAARARETDDRRALLSRHERGDRTPQIVAFRLVVVPAAFEQRDGARDGAMIAGRRDRGGRPARGLPPADAREHILDHAGEPETATVLRRVDLGHPVAFERGDFVGRDRAAAADDDADVVGAELAQHVDHVAEILVVPALVTADRDGVGILGDGGAHDVGDAAVVAEMHHLRATGLQQPADHVDGGVVAVEKGRG